MKFKDDTYFLRLAIKEANKSLLTSEVPVGAVIVRQGKIISRGHNQVEKSKCPTAHAEIIAIEKASKKIGYKHLLDCDLFVTLEPCAMCCGAIVLARIKRLIFGTFDPKTGAAMSLFNIPQDTRLNHYVEVVPNILEEECSQMLKDFFKQLRSKKKNV